MVDRPKEDEDESIGAALERVRWDKGRKKGNASLLEPMHRFFKNFPWEGGNGAAKTPPPEDEAEDQPEP